MSALQSSVSRSQVVAFAGQLCDASSPKNFIRSVVNRIPARRQQGTITVDTAADATVYTWTINGVTLSLLSETSETDETIAAKIADVINAEPAVRGQVSAEAAAAVVTLTAVTPGVGFTASDDDARLTTVQASVTSLEADSLIAGRWATTFGDEDSEIEPGLKSAAIAAAAYLDQQVAAWEYDAYEAGVVLEVVVKVDGKIYPARFTSASNANTSAAGLRDALESALDGTGIVVSGADENIIITAPAGLSFEASAGFASAATTAVLNEVENDGPREGTALAKGGIVLRHLSEESRGGRLTFPGLAGGALVQSGEVWVELAGGPVPSSGDPLFVYVGATAADRGRVYSEAGTDRVQVPRDRARFEGSAAGRGGVTLCRVNLSTDF